MSVPVQVEREREGGRPGGFCWRQPAFFLAAALVAGIASSRAWGLPAGTVLAVLACVLAAGGAAAVRFPRAAQLLAVAAAGLLGAYAAALAPLKPSDSAGRFLAPGGPLENGGTCGFRGTVLERTVDGRGREGGLSRYRIELNALRTGAIWLTARGTAWLDAPERDLPYGARVEGMARARLPAKPGLACEFDYREYLERSGVAVLLRAQYEGLVRVTAPARGRWIGRFFESARRAALARFEERDLEGRGVVPAITIGERAAISRESEEAFVRSGTMHLLAISGLHLAIVGGFFWWMLRAAGVGMRKAAVATLVLAAAYAVLAGARPSVVRSALMVGLFCVATGIDRRPHALSVVSVAAAAMLLWNPLTLYDAGFQMSVVAILGIFYVGQPLARAAKARIGDAAWPGSSLARSAIEAAAFSVGATLAVAPLGLYHFRVVSLIAPVANIVLIPISWALVVSGLLYAGVAAVSDTLAAPLALAASGAEDALIVSARLFAAVPGAYAYSASPPTWAMGVYYAVLALVAATAAAGKKVFPIIAAALVAANILVAAKLVMAPHAPPRAGLVYTSSGEAAIMLDGRGAAAVFLGGRCDEYFAAATLCPWLLDEGVRRIDVIVESAAADVRVRDVLTARFDIERVLRQRRFKGATPAGAAAEDEERDERQDGAPSAELPSERPAQQAGPTGAGAAVSIGPGDWASVGEKWAFTFHSAPPQDFLVPTRLYLPGLIIEAEAAGRRVLVLVDASPGCIETAGRFTGAKPDAAVVCAPRAPQAIVETYVASIGAAGSRSAPPRPANSGTALIVLDGE